MATSTIWAGRTLLTVVTLLAMPLILLGLTRVLLSLLTLHDINYPAVSPLSLLPGALVVLITLPPPLSAGLTSGSGQMVGLISVLTLSSPDSSLAHGRTGECGDDRADANP